MEFTAEKIARITGGEITGDPGVKVYTVARIEEGSKGALSFLANPKYTQYLYTTHSSVVLVDKNFQPEQEVRATLIRVKDAYVAIAKILEVYNMEKFDKKGISSMARVSENARIGKNVYIGDMAFIGDGVTIGDNTMIFPLAHIGDGTTVGKNCRIFQGVKLYDNMVVGNDCTLHAGVVVGSDGFGFAPQSDNHYKKITQIGNVVIEDDVEIGANTTIDRATIGSTIIRKGVKLDNLIQIAHNVEIGENTVIAAQSGIAGSTKIGRNCMIAAQVGIVGHIKIGDNAKIAAQSGISSDVKDNSIVFGSPAFDHSKYRKAYVHFRNLDQIVRRINDMETKLKNLEGENS
ncbi:MAG: UDP-3-O-(3-hydroxymyristoyl)glucosamine N-acyltransferase [Bacteroidales bacterium]